MTEQTETFETRFQAIFDSGVADIKFFVRHNPDLTVEEIREEILGFQLAVDANKVKEVAGVDSDIPQVDFNAAW